MNETEDCEVKRLFLDDSMKDDKFTISLAGELIATVNHETARLFMLGKISPAELHQAAESVAH